MVGRGRIGEGMAQETDEKQQDEQQAEDTDRSPRVSNIQKIPLRAEISNYDIVDHYFTKAVERMDMRRDIAAVLRSSYREVQVQIPVKLSDDRIHVFAGYRVQHNGARGP